MTRAVDETAHALVTKEPYQISLDLTLTQIREGSVSGFIDPVLSFAPGFDSTGYSIVRKINPNACLLTAVRIIAKATVRLRRHCLCHMPDHFALHQKDDFFGDIPCVIGDPFQISGDHNQIQRAGDDFRLRLHC